MVPMRKSHLAAGHAIYVGSPDVPRTWRLRDLRDRDQNAVRTPATYCWRRTVSHFELRFLDRLDVPILKRSYSGLDDLAALAEAQRLSVTHTIEVWDGMRKVARVKKGNVPLAWTDRLAG